MTNMKELVAEKFPNDILIYQQKNGYKFTKDAIDLAKFCKIKSCDHVLELCAGCGVISFYAYSLKKFEKLYLNEIQEDNCKIIEENIKINGLTNAVCLNSDLNNLEYSQFERKVDVIICNPPYFKLECNNTKINDDYSIAISRHEILVSLEQIIKKSASLIKERGKLYLVHLTKRLQEILTLFSKYNFECKVIKFIENKNQSNLALFEAVYKANAGVKIQIEGDKNGRDNTRDI